MKPKLITALLVLGLIAFAATGIANITNTNHKIKTQDIQLKSKQSDLLDLENKFDVLNKQLENKNLTEQKLKELEQQKSDLQKQLDDAQKQLQAKAAQREADKQRLASAASITPKAYAASGNFYKDFIYGKESGNCPTKWQGEYGGCPAYHGVPTNPSVGYGLCQSTPANKMAVMGAGWETSYALQDAWCTNYANKYGGWAGAYTFWVANHFW